MAINSTNDYTNNLSNTLQDFLRKDSATKEAKEFIKRELEVPGDIAKVVNEQDLKVQEELNQTNGIDKFTMTNKYDIDIAMISSYENIAKAKKMNTISKNYLF
ncbi:MAG: hypothetical protein HXX81_02015 [Campylobacterales bacterium]|nr:hypothetical protein [Campylobacterales bacterium]